VGADSQRDGVAAQAPSGAGGEERIAGLSGSFGEPLRQQRFDGFGQGDRAVFASFAFAADVGAGAEGDVGAVQAGEFGDPEPGLDGEQDQCAVSSTFPAALIGRGD
jgi:hypothetical protein